MLDELQITISSRLKSSRDQLRSKFLQAKPTRHAFLDDLLPPAVVAKIFECFPQPSQMRKLSSFREAKFTSKVLDHLDPIISQVTFALQSEIVIREVEAITGIPSMIADPHLYAGGISSMTRGCFLNPHIDNSHDHKRENYRVLNLLYYVSPDWKEENGGNLELWDEAVTTPTTIHNRFNRLVIMETSRKSYHSVSPIVSDAIRCCVSNYYYSPSSPDGEDYFHVTSYSARPEQKFRRILSRIDNATRMLVRRVIRFGIGRQDLYRP